MKYRLALFIICILLSCKKESPPPVMSTPAGASNKIEGDIIWGGINSTHFVNQPYLLSTIYAIFELDTAFVTNGSYQIRMTGFAQDTIVTFQILNPNLYTPVVYNFQNLDSNHFVTARLSSGFTWGGTPPQVSYDGISYSNKGQLTIDTISEKHISGSIDAYCYRENSIPNILDTNEVHLLIHFSGDLRKY
jgi:hypothetical protein